VIWVNLNPTWVQPEFPIGESGLNVDEWDQNSGYIGSVWDPGECVGSEGEELRKRVVN
jgi:hypothetical protein